MLGTYQTQQNLDLMKLSCIYLFMTNLKSVYVCVFVLDPLLFPYIGGRTQVLKAYLLV